MDGNGPTGCIVLPKYYSLIQHLKRKDKKINCSHPLHTMFSKMISKLHEYLQEALQCETLVISTCLHPFYFLKLFETFFKDDFDTIERLLELKFMERSQFVNHHIGIQKNQTDEISQSSENELDIFSVLEEQPNEQGIDELVI